MTDSNQPKQELTFLERFQRMEQTLGTLSYMFTLLNQGYNNLSQNLEKTQTEITAMKDMMLAMRRIAKSKKVMSDSNLVSELVKIEAERIEKTVEVLLQEKTIEVSETVEENGLITFKALPEIELGLASLSTMSKEDQELVLGKKIDDEIQLSNMKITILKVFKQVQPTETKVEAISNEQTQEAGTDAK